MRDGPTHASTHLVAYDFDATGDAALAWGAGLAAPRGGRLVVVHAVDDRVGTLGGGLTGGAHGPAGRADLEPSARQALEKRLAERGLPDAEAVVRSGNVPKTLREEADRTNADLLVAGVHHRSGSLLALGHTADRLTGQVRCPLLLVHADDPPPAADASRTGSGRGPERGPVRRALVAFDIDATAPEAERVEAAGREADAAGDALLRIAAPRSSPRAIEIVLVEATHVPALALGGEASGRHDPQERHRSPAIAALEAAAARLRAAGFSVVGEEVIGGGAPSDLEERAHAQRADLVVIARGEGGLLTRITGGVSGRVAPRLPCPLLVVPLPDPVEPRRS